MGSADRIVADPIGELLIGLVASLPVTTVLDVGGGSGTRSVPLAMHGCRVTVVDTSIDALAMLDRRASEAGVSDRVLGIQADVDRMASRVRPGEADLVLCHHLLETVEDPAGAVTALLRALRPGGLVSVLVAGRFAAVLAHALAGRFEAADVLLRDSDGRLGEEDPLRRRFDIAGLSALLVAGGFEVTSVSGYGVVADLISGSVRRGLDHPELELGRLEAHLSTFSPLNEIAGRLHALAVKPELVG